MIANELRIGNYLGGRNGMVTVSAIQEDGTVWLKEGGKNFIVDSDKPCLLPIPLTEEWLLKFGFKPSGEGYKFTNYLLHEFKFGYSLFEWDSYNEVEVCVKNNIEYVHQLQNLYFVLTNEELTYEQ